MDGIKYISDCQGKLDAEIYGYFQNLAGDNEDRKTVFCLVAGDSDIQTISDLILHTGYTENSLLKKRVIVRITEED